MVDKSISQNTGVGNTIIAHEHAHVEVGSLIINSLSSEDLTKFTRQYLRFICHRRWNDAETYISSLKTLNKLDSECLTLLSILQYHWCLQQQLDSSLSSENFIDLLRSLRTGTTIRDVVESIHIQYLAQTSKATARTRFQDLEVKGSYTTSLYLEQLASLKELNSLLNEGLQDSYEHELCSFVRCAIRCQDFHLATNLARRLFDQYPNDNSSILLNLSSTFALGLETNGKHPWLFDSSEMTRLNEQIKVALMLISRLNDIRIVHTSSRLLLMTWYEHPELFKYCVNNIDEAKNICPQLCELQEKHNDISNNSLDLLKRETNTLSEIEFIKVFVQLERGNITDRQIKKWIDNGGIVSASKEVIDKFSKISLRTIVCDSSDLKEQEQIINSVHLLVENHPEEIKSIHVLLLKSLCSALLQLKLPIAIVQLLGKLIPDRPWCSPLVELYADALLSAEQFDELDKLISVTDRIEASHHMSALRIERLCSLGELDEAIELVKLALESFNNSQYMWLLELRILHMREASFEEINTELEKFPKGILSTYSNNGLNFLFLLAKTHASWSDAVFLEWFLDDPVGMAKHFTNYHLENVVRGEKSESLWIESVRCSRAIVFRQGKRKLTKMLVDDCDANEHFIDLESPLGSRLAEMKEGELSEESVGQIEVLEILSPVVGASRIAAHIRNDMNMGDDCFYFLELDEDAEAEEILETISSIPKSAGKLNSDISRNSYPVPLLLRINRTYKNQEIRGAFVCLTDHKVNEKFRLYSEGLLPGNKLVLDTLSLAYFSISGLYHGLLDSDIELYLTGETMEIVTQWLDIMTKSDYLSLVKRDEEFFRISAKDIAQDEGLQNLRLLVQQCKILAPQSFDMQVELLKYREHMGESHYSSLRASLSYSLPVLCIDPVFCTFYRSLDVPIVDTYAFMRMLRQSDSVSVKRLAQCHLFFKLPVPLIYEDVVSMAGSDQQEQYLASEIIRIHSNDYGTPDVAIDILTRCCVRAIATALLYLRGNLSLSEWRYTENIVNQCCASAILSLTGENQEQRIARLIYEVLHTFSPDQGAVNFSMKLFRRFVSGHFMDGAHINKEILCLQEKQREVDNG